MFILIFQQLLLESFLDLLYFPLWWYTGGVKYAGERCLELFGRGNGFLAPGLWLKNIFIPMFGQYDLQGRLISFFMRLVQVIFRSIALLGWLVFCIAVFLLWLAVPVIIVCGFIKIN